MILTNPKITIAFADNITSKMLETLFNNGFEVSVMEKNNIISALHNIQPDLIVFDPSYCGIGLIKEIKSHPRLHTVPLIATAKKVAQESKIRIMSLNVDDFISKPFYTEELVARIELILSEKSEKVHRAVPSSDNCSGSLRNMNIFDLVQLFEIGGNCGIIRLVQEQLEGKITVNKGIVVNAGLYDFDPLTALYKLVLWSEGSFKLHFTNTMLSAKIEYSYNHLVKEHSKRADLWKNLANTIPVQKSDLLQLRKDLRNAVDGKTLAGSFRKPKTIFNGVMSCDTDALTALRQIKTLLDENVLIEPDIQQKQSATLENKDKQIIHNPVASLLNLGRKKILPSSLVIKTSKKNINRIPKDLLQVKNNN
ncbi:DUF4388 domain-containing protein [candidate division KSB1 bacterium]|nr:DUF4388 domain-containing protein [candidate division KSB1 bacterium]